MIKKSPRLQQNSDSSDDSNSDNSNSDNQENEVKVKDQVTEIDSKKENKREAQPVESVKNKSTEIQQKSDLGDDSSSDKNSDRGKQESERKEKGLLPRIETRESGNESKTKTKHVEDESEKEESQELKQRSNANDGFKRNSISDDQVSDGKVKDPAAKIENIESKQETKIEAQPVESVRKDSSELKQKSDLAEDSKGNDNSKSDKQKLGGKMKELAVNMQNKENEKEIKINAQPFEDKLVRSESPELQQKNYLDKNFKGSNNPKIDEQESDGKVKDPAAKSEYKAIKKETKMKVQPVEDKSVRKELPAFGQKNHSADKSDEQVVEVKVPAAKSEIKESKKETKIYTQPVESESVGKSSEQANKALPTEKKERKKEDFRQTTEVPREYGLNKRVQVDRYDVMSTRQVGTQTGLKLHSVGTFTSGLIKKVNMQTYTSGLISTSDHSTNTIQKRGNDKKTQTEDQYVLESHLTIKYNDSSEKTTTDNEDTTKESGENETSVQSKRSKRKLPLVKLSYSPNLTESTESRPPPPDSLSKKGTQSKDIKSNQKYQNTPFESSGVYSNKEHGKKTRKEKENIRRRGLRRRQFFVYSKRHPSGEYIPKPSKNKMSLFRPTSAGPVYKRESIHLMHRPEDSIPPPSQNKISLRPNSAGPVHKRQCKHPEGTPLSAAQYRMLYHHRWPDIPF